MSAVTTEGAERDSSSSSSAASSAASSGGAAEHGGTGEPGEPRAEQQAPPEQREPADEEGGSDADGATPGADKESVAPGKSDRAEAGAAGGGGGVSEPGQSAPSPGGSAGGGAEPPKREQREESASSPPGGRTKKSPQGARRPGSAERSSSDGEPLSRMDSEDSISSTLMDVESGASSGRSTPAMMNGHGGGAGTVAGGGAGAAPGGGGGGAGGGGGGGGGKALGYTCCWDHCHLLFPSSPDLAEHIRSMHVDGQRGGVFVCLWKGCKVYNTPSTSQSWLQRHMVTHSGDKPFKCVVGGCNATFASQGGLARHVPTHFSSQGSSRPGSQGRLKEESPSKAGLSKRRKLKNKRRRSLPRPHDFFDAQTMDAIRHRAICLNLATHIESLGNGHSVVFHSTVIARRKEDSGKVKVLLHWTPEDILPDVWVNESDRQQQKTKVVHLSKLPTDTAVLLDPNIYRMFF